MNLLINKVDVTYEIAESIRLTEEFVDFLDFENRSDIVSWRKKSNSEVKKPRYTSRMVLRHNPNDSLWYKEFYKEMKQRYEFLNKLAINQDKINFKFVIHQIQVTPILFNTKKERGLMVNFAYHYDLKR